MELDYRLTRDNTREDTQTELNTRKKQKYGFDNTSDGYLDEQAARSYRKAPRSCLSSSAATGPVKHTGPAPSGARNSSSSYVRDHDRHSRDFHQLMFTEIVLRGPGSSVGIATDYGLDGPGIESRWGRDFTHLSRPALGPTQPPVQWVPGISRG